MPIRRIHFILLRGKLKSPKLRLIRKAFSREDSDFQTGKGKLIISRRFYFAPLAPDTCKEQVTL